MDMFMKNLKPLVHATHCVLKITVPSIKKAKYMKQLPHTVALKVMPLFNWQMNYK
jgi:hypothetical protein